uniref:tRNA N(3)-methylcytidine methyltransferase n=1 Tax=Hydra vulgaris TaxID=6087 RepID=T2M6X6_HYDVU
MISNNENGVMEDSLNDRKRQQFGSRFLTEEADVFQHNAWDDVEWDSDLEDKAKQKIQFNSTVTFSAEELELYEIEADKYWNSFYCQHQNKFFKDRQWLFTEFNELNKVLRPVGEEVGEEVAEECKTQCSINADKLKDEVNLYNGCQTKTRILEVGCGVGNTVFPILQTSNNPNLFIYCCDFAESAIQILKEHPLYNENRCHAFVCDVTACSSFPCPENSLDFIILIFVLSSIHPDRMLLTLQKLTKLLKPGGMLLFRDYGRYDMAQLRFKPGKCLGDNFYLRGDGTRVYFFTQAEIDTMLTSCGLVKEQNIVDRRLQVNRGRQLKMYRVWIQSKYRKPNYKT